MSSPASACTDPASSPGRWLVGPWGHAGKEEPQQIWGELCSSLICPGQSPVFCHQSTNDCSQGWRYHFQRPSSPMQTLFCIQDGGSKGITLSTGPSKHGFHAADSACVNDGGPATQKGEQTCPASHCAPWQTKAVSPAGLTLPREWPQSLVPPPLLRFNCIPPPSTGLQQKV